MIERHLFSPILDDLEKKMVWVAGPRQSGKTTLSEQVLHKRGGRYYSWEDDKDRRDLRSGRLDPDAHLWVLDEIHKYRFWRNGLKGIYDKNKHKHSILVTGSARLETFSRGGDSLQGRYFLYRLHPFTLSELLGPPRFKLSDFPQFLSRADSQKVVEDLSVFGGFPEPFLSGSERESRRWRLGYGSLLMRNEVRDLDLVRNLDKMELLYDRLPSIVGSVLSINSLREDLEVAFETVRGWIQILESLLAVFRVSPFGGPRIRAVKKEQKLYFWDWAAVEDPAARFENLVGSHLMRLSHWVEDFEGIKCELRYFRDRTRREVDFVLLKGSKPWIAVECKTSDRPLDPNLKFLLERVEIPYAFQVSMKGKQDFESDPIGKTRVRLLPASKFLTAFP